MPYTFQKTPSGTVEISQNGQRISTGSESYARSLGYTGADSKLFQTPSGATVDATTGQLITPPPSAPIAGVTAPITPQSSTPVTPFTPVTPNFTPPYDLSRLEIPEITATPKQREQSDMSARLEEINKQLLGKTAFEEEKKLELVEPAQQAYEDLARQIRDIQKEQELVPLVLRGRGMVSEGRGRTEAGVEPLEIGRRAALAYDALKLSSRLDAAQGFLATAERKLEAAMRQKYGPLEEEQRMLQANLNIIKNDPETTIQEQNRIAKREAQIKAREDAIKKLQEDEKEILRLANEASKNLSERGKITTEANLVIENATKQAKTPLEARLLLSPYLLKPKDALAGTGPELQKFAALHPELKVGTEAFRVAFEAYTKKPPEEKFSDFFPNVDITTPEGQRMYLDWKAKQAEAGRAPSGAPGIYVPGTNPAVDNWARLIIAGQAKITDVPNPRGSTLRTDVTNAIATSGQLLLSDKDREKLSTLDTAFNVANTIKGLSEKINTFGVAGRITGFLSRYIGGKAQYNEDIARYNAAREGFVSNVARTLGEKGTLAEGDVRRAIANLPTVNDTKGVAEGKLKTLFSILEGTRSSIIQKSTEPLREVTSGTLLQNTPEALRAKYNY